MMNNQIILQHDYIVTTACRKYKSFSNYPDLLQEGRLALILSLQTYNPQMNNFPWWADKYVQTRIKRKANQHTDIHIPIKYGIKPSKLSDEECNAVIDKIDKTPNAEQRLIKIDNLVFLQDSISKLPKEMQEIIDLNLLEVDVGNICQILGIGRKVYFKLFNQAKKLLYVMYLEQK